MLPSTATEKLKPDGKANCALATDRAPAESSVFRRCRQLLLHETVHVVKANCPDWLQHQQAVLPSCTSGFRPIMLALHCNSSLTATIHCTNSARVMKGFAIPKWTKSKFAISSRPMPMCILSKPSESSKIVSSPSWSVSSIS